MKIKLLFLLFMLSVVANAQIGCPSTLSTSHIIAPDTTTNDYDQTFRSLAVNPLNPDHVVVGTEGNAVFISRDGGQHWKWKRDGFKHFVNDGYAETWTILFDPHDTSILFASTADSPGPATGAFSTASAGVYKSNNRGNTWYQRNCGLPASSATAIWCDKDSSQNMLVAIAGGAPSFTNPPQPFYTGGIYYSSDSGATWNKATTPVNIDSAAFWRFIQSGDTIITYGLRINGPQNTGVGFMKSLDKGRTWQLFGSPLPGRMVPGYTMAKGGQHIAASVRDSGVVYTSSDGGDSWTRLNVSINGELQYHPESADTILFADQNLLYKSRNGIITGNLSSPDYKLVATFPNYIEKIVFAPSDPMIIYVSTRKYHVYKSMDGGETFMLMAKMRDMMGDTLSTVYDVEGNEYNTVTIGNRIWMKENLNTVHFANGDPIPNVTSNTSWKNLSTPSYSNFQNSTANGEAYGRLYNAYAMEDPRRLCPQGWKIPSDDDWNELAAALGGTAIAGDKLRSAGGAWADGGGNNSSGFTALPGGYRWGFMGSPSDDGQFNALGNVGAFWSSTDTIPAEAMWWFVSTSMGGGIGKTSRHKTYGFSIRCILNNDSLSLSVDSIQAVAAGDSVSVQLESNASWTVINSASWITADPVSGNGNALLSVRISANTGPARSATVNITTGNITKTIYVAQAIFIENLTANTDTIQSSFQGDTVAVQLTSNASWTVNNPASWITVSPANGSGNSILSFKIAANTGPARSATVNITGVSISQIIYVSQTMFIESLLLDRDTILTASSGDTIPVQLTSNTNWTVSNPVSWITINPASGSGDDTLSVKIAKNTGILRSATVVVNAGGISKEMYVSQGMNTDTLTLEKDTIQSASEAMTLGVVVTSNTIWTPISPVPWIVVNPQQGNGNGFLTLFIAVNAGAARSATVSVTAGNITRTIYVSQAAFAGYLTLGTDTIESPVEGDTSAIALSSNTSWTVTNPASWIIVNPMTGNGNVVLSCAVSENTSTTIRTATITVTAGSITKSFNVIQDALTTGLKMVSATEMFALYPNPSTGKLTLKSLRAMDSEVEIFDLNGKLVDHFVIKGRDEAALDYSTRNNGLYIIHMKDQQSQSMMKVMISK
jgi:uncharacterized protein (TIGR02145 family)